MTDSKEAMFRRVERKALTHMHHGYLTIRNVRQAVSRFHFDAGYAILSAAAVKDDEVEQVLTALLLLEQGLSIHDDVDRCQSSDQGLIVLAGDYDSSKYYYILAGVGDSALMFSLCEAVVQINEAKMALLLSTAPLSTNEYMRLMKVVEGQLLKALACHYLGEDGQWMLHIDSLVQAYIVQDELRAHRFSKRLTTRQASEWLSHSLEQLEMVAGGALTNPLYSFLVEYFGPIRETVRDLQLAEGKG
ncbi:Heptaprenyl diphosphate synthase (HEPPP synthase) subunit 1 [Alicyclobacillus hesperidum]|uniref:Heptaprenyl diphosphate synthase (HEPPP synthase) subunit 1 n=1 Tax=Alicyclobacillus hesperidum TaxID=89784 RepID=A0A1H2XTB0_9BACL|nr:heptaprenyl diphosphate synthase component 1 [Alicyclobacillus hesperidum]SDW96035.1 Heptaprenyl diphosphate synthase (HEPPP synthase) subunit 1 [Alicyclobacillus hesperidum]